MQISQKYSKIFEKYWSYKTTPEVEKEILATADFFDKGKTVIEKLEKSADESLALFNTFDKKSEEIVVCVQELTKRYSKVELYLNQREPLSNPYTELKTWCRNTLLEVKGVFECIHLRSGIEKYKSTLLSKVQDEKKSIEKRQAGKKKLIQYLNKKSNEYYISQSEALLQQLNEIIAAIDVILNISAAIILQEELVMFKQKKLNGLQLNVEVFEEISEKALNDYVDRYREIKDKL